MKTASISTDGACIGNPGPGGWAAVLRSGSVKKEIFGSEPHTTNNRMELRAVIEALKGLKEPCQVTIHTDSQYVQLGITQWIQGWKARGWQKRDKGAVLNRDLWTELDALIQTHEISWAWVKGHADHEDNIRCDALARKAAEQQINSGPRAPTVRS